MTGKQNIRNCFWLGRPPVHYSKNNTASSNWETFKKWFNSVFLPYIRSCTFEKVALLVDNASSYSNLYDICEQVVVIFAPFECNFRAPAHGYGSNFNMKTDVQAVFGARLVRDIESRAERRAFYQERTYGMNGMARLRSTHVGRR